MVVFAVLAVAAAAAVEIEVFAGVLSLKLKRPHLFEFDF